MSSTPIDGSLASDATTPSSLPAADMHTEGIQTTDSIVLGGAQASPHHPLALDPEGNGFWGRIDQLSFRFADRLNPILVKECRQALKSRGFLIAFFLLLFATIVWSVMGIVWSAPDVYYLPSGTTLLAGYYFLMAIPILGLVPLGAARSLAGELEGDTFELLSITKLSSTQIVRGKFGSAVLQMMLYFAAVVPSLAFSYLLRGVSLLDIAMFLVAIGTGGLLIVAFAQMLAPLMNGFFGQSFITIVLIISIIIVQWTVAAICLGGVLAANMSGEIEAWFATAAIVAMLLTFVVQFMMVAAAQIAPVTENRSTPIRKWMLFQQALWLTVSLGACVYYEAYEPMNFALFVATTFWLFVGTILLAENPELSPRIRRDLPSTMATRSIKSGLVPGPSSGYLLALTATAAASITFGLFGLFVSTSDRMIQPLLMGLLCTGYLASYLGLTRLICLPLRRFGPIRMPLTLSVLLLLLLGSMLLPSILNVALFGTLPGRYNDLQIFNWFWTLIEAFDGDLPAYLPLGPFMFGSFVTLVNFLFLKDMYAYRRVAVPQRVLDEEASLQMSS
ncbi:MAG: hypothetical protein AAF958_15880 [Planctomycetota bacterium]